MSCIVFMVEEISAKVMLKSILKRILPDEWDSFIFSFEGKQDLDKQIEKKIKGWTKENTYFVILRDMDSGDCVKIKERLLQKVQKTGKSSNTLVRIACHELESFYLGDLDAVEKGLNIKGISLKQKKSKLRNPDKLANAAEELRKITKNKYQKVSGSRAIAPLLDLNGKNLSHSFNVLIEGVRRIVGV